MAERHRSYSHSQGQAGVLKLSAISDLGVRTIKILAAPTRRRLRAPQHNYLCDAPSWRKLASGRLLSWQGDDRVKKRPPRLRKPDARLRSVLGAKPGSCSASSESRASDRPKFGRRVWSIGGARFPRASCESVLCALKGSGWSVPRTSAKCRA